MSWRAMGFPVASDSAPEIKVPPPRGTAHGRQYKPMYADLGFSVEAGRFPGKSGPLISVMFPKLMKVNVMLRIDPTGAVPPGIMYGVIGLQASPPPMT